MDTGYPALIADPPSNHNAMKPLTVQGASDSEKPQPMLTNSEPPGSPPTIEQAS